MSTDASAEIARLREEIRHHDRKYYVEAAPEISDRDYDRLIERLKKLEAEHPKLVTPDSPTQRIGDRPVEGLVQVEHRVPMLSIENTYSLDELKKYGDRVAKLLPGEAGRVGGRAEGGRRGRFVDLRRRPADARRHPRQRPRGRRHHPQRPHDQGHSAAARRAGPLSHRERARVRAARRD